MKAYVVYWPGSFVDHPEQGGVYIADTASKARYRAYCAAADIGYDVRLPDFVVRRAPQYDPLVGVGMSRYGIPVDGWCRSSADRLLAEAS